MSESKTKVYIVDDHPVFRDGLKHVINGDPRFVVVGEAAAAADALAGMKTLHPHVALLDIDLPDQNGIKLAGAVHQLRPAPQIVILTGYKEEALFNAAMDAGVKGYILKENAVSDIMGAIKAAAAGEVYLSPTISSFLLRRGERREQLRRRLPELAQLTPTERRILKLVAENKTSRDIGQELFISFRTVETHRANICQKLQLGGAHPLLEFALRHKSEL